MVEGVHELLPMRSYRAPSSDAISGPTSTTRSLLTAFARFTICATVSSEPPMTAMRSRLAAEASSAALLTLAALWSAPVDGN